MDDHGLMMVMVLRELTVLLVLVLVRAMAAIDGASLGNCQHWSSVRPCPSRGLTRGGVAGRPPKLARIDNKSLARAVHKTRLRANTVFAHRVGASTRAA